MRLLVLRPGALGDLLLALPGLRSLKAGLPEARLEVAASQPSVLSLAPDLVASHDFGSALFTPLYCEDGPPSDRLARFLARFERVALLCADPDGLIRRRLAAHGVGQLVGGTLEPRPSVPPHMAVRLAMQLGLGGLHEGPMRATLLRLDCPAARHVWLHPGAGGVPKRWPLECFASLGRLLASAGRPVRILSGPADERLGEQLAAMLKLPEVAVARPGHLHELASELAGGAAFAGNDSGPAHLAGLLGLPTVAVFGPTAPEVWAPCGPRVRVVATDRTGAWPAPEQVAEALLTLL